jgi:hypothetical protein
VPVQPQSHAPCVPRPAGAVGTEMNRHIIVLADYVQHLLANDLQCYSHFRQYMVGHAFLFAQEAKQKVFRANVVVIKVARFLNRVFDDFLGPRRLGQLAPRHHVGPWLNDFLDFQAYLAQALAHRFDTLLREGVVKNLKTLARLGHGAPFHGLTDWKMKEVLPLRTPA